MQEQVQPGPMPSPDWWSSGTAAARPTQVTVPVLAPTRGRARNVVLSLLILVGGGTVVVGSRLPWITTTLLHHTASVDGTTHAVAKTIGTNGWYTLGGGAALAVLALLLIATGQRSLRGLATLVAMATAGFAIYDLVRVVQKTDHANAEAAKLGAIALKLGVHSGVGYGLVMVVAAASATVLVATIGMGGGE